MARMILVVDDEALSRMCTQRILENFGFEVVSAEGGQEAVDAAGDFDAIIMDCQMPQVDGFQATAAIRRRQRQTRSAAVPIIGLSGRAMEGDREIALAKGMDEYITKPVRVHKLQAALDGLGVKVAARSTPREDRSAGTSVSR